IGDLAVISRTSTLKYGSHPENLQTVGKQLGVATILEGSVQKVGDQVLVNVQLIDARNDHHIWADSYTRTLKNVFSVEGEVAQKIADTLKAKLSPAEAQRLATTLSGNTVANDLYLQGEYFAHRGDLNLDPTAMKQAVALYRQAAARAPDFAEARARLSMVESELAWYGGGGKNTAALFADALSQAEQALKLAPNLADAHLALGMYEYWGKGDYPAALKAISAALALRPNDAGATVAKAFVLRRQGRFRQAIGMLRKAQALDPRDVMIPMELGNTYASIGQYAQAEQAVRHALVLDPANGLARATSAIMIVFRSGDLTKALAQAQGDEPRIQFYRAYLLILARQYGQALTLLQSMPDSKNIFNAGNGGYFGPKALHVASVYALLGEQGKAREYYARALPQARAQYAALAGSPSINQALALTIVAQAELGLGRSRAGMADTAKALAVAAQSNDHFLIPYLMLRCAQRYAQAGRADKAVPVLSAALDTPEVGRYFSPVMLWIDPAWDPIRKSPAFQGLLKKYARYHPPLEHDPAPPTSSAGP
ncbi:MAG: tetratricopeptide repeat protein, partial [Rhodanobacteraceae bacterium]